MPVASAVLPGPSGPFTKEMLTVWSPGAADVPGPLTRIVSVLATVAVAQLAPLTWMLLAAPAACVIVAVSLSGTLTVTNPLATVNEHVGAALAVTGSTSAAAQAATPSASGLRHPAENLKDKVEPP